MPSATSVGYDGWGSVGKGATKTNSIGTNWSLSGISSWGLSWPGLSGDESFVAVTSSHGVGTSGLCFVAGVGEGAGLALVCVGHIPAMGPTIIVVVVATNRRLGVAIGWIAPAAGVAVAPKLCDLCS